MEIMIRGDIEGKTPVNVADIIVNQTKNMKRVKNAFVVHRDSYTSTPVGHHEICIWCMNRIENCSCERDGVVDDEE